MASPIADSAAATIKTKIIKICPIISSKYIEKIAKFKFTANNKSSIDIRVIKIFFRFKAIPIKPMKKIRQFSFII